MELTQVATNIELDVVSLLLNTEFTPENQERILELQQQIEAQLPGVCWFPPADTLHITLMDWVAPLVDYGTDKQQLVKQVQPKYMKALRDVLERKKPIKVWFNEIGVSDNAIFLKGVDDGSYAQIRNEFLERAELLPGTKPPPTIIHSSIARYKDQIAVEEVLAVVDGLSIDFEHTTNEFRLIEETSIPMLRYEVVDSMTLESA